MRACRTLRHKFAVGLVGNDKRLEGSILTMQSEVFQKQLPQVFLGDVFWNEPMLGVAVIPSWRQTTLLANKGQVWKNFKHTLKK